MENARTSVDAPRKATADFEYKRHLSDAAICPASWCSIDRHSPHARTLRRFANGFRVSPSFFCRFTNGFT